MNKKLATAKAKEGITAGDLREVLNTAEFDEAAPCKINGAINKRLAYDTLHAAIANIHGNTIVDKTIAANILYEFGK